MKEQYFAEQRGEAIEGAVPLNVDKQRIQELEKQRYEVPKEVRLSKKAAAWFILDHPK